MNQQADVEAIGYCLDSVNENLKFIEKRLVEIRGELTQVEGFPESLKELDEEVRQRFQNVNNTMLGLPFR